MTQMYEEQKEQIAKIPDVQVWQVIKGRITELLIMGDLFVIREGLAESINPIEVAKNFIDVFDVKKTILIRSVKSTDAAAFSTSSTTKKRTVEKTVSRASLNPKKRRQQVYESGTYWAKCNSIAIYKERIIDLYRKMPDSFSMADVNEYILSVYPNISGDTCKNKARAYVQYLHGEGYLSKEKLFGRAFVYKFIKVPFDTEKPAQAEPFDTEYLKTSKALELQTARGEA